MYTFFHKLHKGPARQPETDNFFFEALGAKVGYIRPIYRKFCTLKVRMSLKFAIKISQCIFYVNETNLKTGGKLLSSLVCLQWPSSWERNERPHAKQFELIHLGSEIKW